MGMNTFDALMAEVNLKISEANTAVSQANAAAAAAAQAAEKAGEEGQTAAQMAQQAQEAAQKAEAAADEWENMTIQTETTDANGEASVKLTKEESGRKLSFVIPRGKDGEKGAKGDTGRSGVKFTLSGTKLYMTTE